ncbi:MAG TPA: peptidylprolyl isomerase [Candidatus Babeliales bacterium]|nr:peptidylprolyl isomerase [Candidatus Babeliales bacterium]
MITVIRERLLKNKGYKYVVWFLAATLAIMWTMPALKRFGGQGMWIALVNGQEVSYGDFARKAQIYQVMLQSFRQQHGQYADAFLQAMGLSTDPKVLALEEVTREELMNQAARSLKIQLNDEYVSERLADPQFAQQVLPDLVPSHVFTAHGINMKQLQAYLRQVGLSWSEFESKVQEALLRYLLLELVSLSVYVPSFELKDAYNARYLGKSFSILTFSLEKVIEAEKKKPVSAQDLEAYFQAQNAMHHRFWIPEKRTGTVWKFEPSSYGITIDEESIQLYYDEHKTDYTEKPATVEVRTLVFKVDGGNEQELYKKAKAIRDELVANPQSFAEKARELSQDESSKEGGLLPAFAKGSKEHALNKAAFTLKNDGDISDVIRTSKGFEIIQRVSKTNPTYKPLKAVKAEIQDALLHKRFGEQFAHDMNSIIDQKDITDSALESFITQRGGVATSYNKIEKGTSKASQVLFDLKVGEITFYVDNGVGYAAQLKSLDKSYLPSLDSIKEVVSTALYEERAAKHLATQLAQAKEEASTKTMQMLANQYGATLKLTGMIKKDAVESLKSLQEQGLPVDQLFHLEQVGQVGIFNGGTKGFLVKVEEVEAFNEDDFKAKKAELLQSVLQEKVRTITAGFVASLYRTATIKANESLLYGNYNPRQEFQYDEE